MLSRSPNSDTLAKAAKARVAPLPYMHDLGKLTEVFTSGEARIGEPCDRWDTASLELGLLMSDSLCTLLSALSNNAAITLNEEATKQGAVLPILANLDWEPFDVQQVEAVPRDAYDEPLDWVMTPSGPIKMER